MSDTPDSTTSDNIVHPIAQLLEQKTPCPFCADEDSGFARNPRPIEDELIAALEEIAYPVEAMQARAKAEGKELNGWAAVQAADSASYLQSIAKRALARVSREATNG